MPQVPTLILWLWVPCTLWFFKRWPAPLAVLLSMIGGWLILPTAAFSAETARSGFPYWVMPACLPALWTTKARMIALGCLLGLLLFHRNDLRVLRIIWADYVMIAWCACPLVSAELNRLYLTEAIADTVYQSLCWGVPYLVGRLYFASPTGMSLLARGMITGGLSYVPLCLVEWVSGPWLYQALYGFHPYQSVGTPRYVGSRPIVFLEDGNQLGMWLATAAIIALWLWRCGQAPRIQERLPGGLTAVVLVGIAVLSQSVGAIALLLAAALGLELVRRINRGWPLAVVLVLVLGFVSIRAANLVDAKALAQRTGVGRALIQSMVSLDRASLGWRLRQEERHARTALERPWFGWGRWDWWRDGIERPWGLFSLVLGMYGLVGLSLLLACLVIPLVRFLSVHPPREWSSADLAPTTALAAALAINALDAILNGAFLLPLMIVAGGLVGLDAGSAPAATRSQETGHVRYRVR